MMAGLLEVLGDPGISRISCLQYVTAVASTDRPQLVTPERVEPKSCCLYAHIGNTAWCLYAEAHRLRILSIQRGCANVLCILVGRGREDSSSASPEDRAAPVPSATKVIWR